MYQTNYYHQNLGTAGHRATSSYNYLPQYTPNNYYQPNHHHSNSMYSYMSAPAPPTQAYQAGYLQPAQVQPVQPQYIAPPSQYVAPPPPPPAAAPAPAPAPAQQEEVNGGINPVLEYDLNSMSTFLSWCSFGMLKQNKNPTKEFENLIVSVLFATRLPKSTIIIALEYMNQRFSSKQFGDLSESDIFTKLTIALILANKFNDDNTFTNRSWCGATGLKIELLNHEERVWLTECKWQLNVVNFESNIKTLEECWLAWLDKYGVSSTTTQPELMNTTKSNNYYSSPISSSPSLSNHQSYPYSGDYLHSIPSSPVYSNNYSNSNNYSSPLSSSPLKYAHDSIWTNYSSNQQRYQPHPNQQNIWSYTPSNYNPYGCNEMIYNSNFVGYSNPYYSYNIPTC